MKSNHHRRSIRLKGYDYSQSGLYFITICTKNREHLFGQIINGVMCLNDYGEIAMQCWREIPQHYPNAVLHEYVVMPNHIHGIIEIIDDTTFVGAQNFVPLQTPQQNQFQKIIPRSIGAIVRGFKIGVTVAIRANVGESVGAQNLVPLQNKKSIWQSNYHEHIIRNHRSYQHIAQYITNNPAIWENDRYKN